MQTNTAIANSKSTAAFSPRVVEGSKDMQLLQNALNNWREQIVNWLGDEMLKAGEERRSAEEGLAIAQRHPGAVAEDVIQTLWEKLEKSCVMMCRLDRVINRMEELDLANLITLFSRTQKSHSWPWEGDRWVLPSSMF